jgi:hypothetical protein
MTKRMTERFSPEGWYARAVAKTPDWSPLDEDTPPLDLTLPHGAKLSAMGVVLPEELDADEWFDVGKKLVAIKNGVQWALGEWWAFGRHKYGHRAMIAKTLPYEFETLMNLGWVARSVPTSSRNEALSWTHHKAVAKFNHTTQQYWLEKADEEHWSVKTLERKIKDQDKTDRTEADHRREQKDPDGYRIAKSHKTAADAIFEFGKADAGIERAVQARAGDHCSRAPTAVLDQLCDSMSSAISFTDGLKSAMCHSTTRMRKLTAK